MALIIRAADGNDLRSVVDVGRRTWPLTYGPIAGEDYVAMGLAKWWTEDATIPAIRAGRVVASATGVYPEIRISYLEGNTLAEAFYRGKGFVEISRESGGEGIPDSIWMKFELDPGEQ